MRAVLTALLFVGATNCFSLRNFLRIDRVFDIGAGAEVNDTQVIDIHDNDDRQVIDAVGEAILAEVDDCELGEAECASPTAVKVAYSPNENWRDDIPGHKTLQAFFSRLNKFGSSKLSPCNACKHVLKILRHISIYHSSSVPAALDALCSHTSQRAQHSLGLCSSLRYYHSGDGDGIFSFLPDLTNALRSMDVDGLDGEYFCHYMFSDACPRPVTPKVNYEEFWPEAPAKIKKPKSRGNTFKVLHLSDIHLQINYTEGSPANCLSLMCCEERSLQNPLEPRLGAPKWGYYWCDAPPALLDSTLRDARRFQYEFALFTGDMVDHNPVFISKHDTILEEEVSLRSLKRELGMMPVYPVLGNHDSYPYGQEPQPSSPYTARTQFNIDLMQHLWSSEFKWIDKPTAGELRCTRGAYAVMAKPGLKIITLNSNFWYRWNFYMYDNVKEPDTSGVFRFLIDELAECEKLGIRAWVQAHVPPGGLPDEALPFGSSFLTAILQRFSDTIAATFFGHTHLDEFIVLYNGGTSSVNKSEENAIGTAWIAPSITPFTEINPSWRYYEVDADTFEIMDSVTYAAAIEPSFGYSWPNAPDLMWLREYSARETYGPQIGGWPASEPLNGRFWHRVAERILKDPCFSEDFVKRSYRFTPLAPQCKSRNCQVEHYCYATSMSVDQVEDCYCKYGASNSGEHKNRHKPKYKDERGHPKQLHGVPTFPMRRPKRHSYLD